MTFYSISVPSSSLPSETDQSIKSDIDIFLQNLKKFTIVPENIEFLFASLLLQGFSGQKYVEEVKIASAAYISKDNVTTFTVVCVKNENWAQGETSTIMDKLIEKYKSNMGLDSESIINSGNSDSPVIERCRKLAEKCIKKNDSIEEEYLKRHRLAFNPFNILSELRLMKKYPDVLYKQLSEGGIYNKAFKKDNPNYKEILTYLKSSSGRESEFDCSSREMGAWALAWELARNNELYKNPIATKSSNYIHYYGPTAGFIYHIEYKYKIDAQFIWEIEDLSCNDWGAAQLIIFRFLKDKDPRIWKWLLSDDNKGYRYMAMVPAKYQNKVRIGLIWYDKITDNQQAPTFNERGTDTELGVSSEWCTKIYAFYTRRLYDYDPKAIDGAKRKCGEGETHQCEAKAYDHKHDNPKSVVHKFSQPGCNIPTGCEGPTCQESPMNCPIGYKIENNVCVKVICPFGYYLDFNDCKKKDCKKGYVLNSITAKCEKKICRIGYKLDENTSCIEIICKITETKGTDGKCVQKICKPAYQLNVNTGKCIQKTCRENKGVKLDLKTGKCIKIVCPKLFELTQPGDVCKSKVCPKGKGIYLNPETGECEKIECQVGDKLKLPEDICMAIECEAGKEFNIKTLKCETKVCKDDEVLNGDNCVKKPCMAGYKLDAKYVCVKITCPKGLGLELDQRTFECKLIICPPGYELVKANDNCSQIVCKKGTKFSSKTKKCEKTICQIGYILDAITGECIEKSCPKGYLLKPNTNDCVKKICPKGFYWELGVCQEIVICTGNKIIKHQKCEECKHGWTADHKTNRCFINCPSGDPEKCDLHFYDNVEIDLRNRLSEKFEVRQRVNLDRHYPWLVDGPNSLSPNDNLK